MEAKTKTSLPEPTGKDVDRINGISFIILEILSTSLSLSFFHYSIIPILHHSQH